MSSSIDKTELQKLVDGELDLASSRRLAKSAETDPSQWRQIATAFIEDRLWQKSFQRLDQDSNFSNMETLQSETAAKATPVRTPASVSFPSWLALAAGLLLAAGIGFYAGSSGSIDRRIDDATSGLVAVEDSPEAKNLMSKPKELTLADLKPEYELELTDAMGVGKSSVPLYSARRLNQLPQSQQSVFAGGPSNQQLNQWRQSGYQLQQNVDYLSGRLKDGRSFVVPVQTINVSAGQ
jgi:hypothetical protein